MIELDKTSNQSTQVAFLLIETLAEIGEPASVSELARRTGMPKSRVFRFLKTLLGMGYVLQDPETERYRLSLKIFHLGQAVADRTALLSEARPVMTRLRDDTGQTVTLSLIEPQGMRVLDIVRAESPVQIVTRPGSLLDFHSSAQGKVALAFGDEALWRRVQAGPLEPWTCETNTDLKTLRAEVERVRGCGWAEAPQQTLLGINALSAPILDVGDAMIATVTIAGPINALPSPPPQPMVALVTQAARAISANIGCREYLT